MNTDTIRSELSVADFRRISDFVRSDFGINLTAAKKGMVESRLRKRLVGTQCTTYAEYVEFLFTEDGLKNELVHMIDAVSTNKTDFFREPAHFEYLTKHVLPELWRSGYGDPDSRADPEGLPRGIGSSAHPRLW